MLDCLLQLQNIWKLICIQMYIDVFRKSSCLGRSRVASLSHAKHSHRSLLVVSSFSANKIKKQPPSTDDDESRFRPGIQVRATTIGRRSLVLLANISASWMKTWSEERRAPERWVSVENGTRAPKRTWVWEAQKMLMLEIYTEIYVLRPEPLKHKRWMSCACTFQKKNMSI